MAELIGGLAVLGHYMNGRSDKQQLENNKNKLETENTSGKNIFDNNRTPKVLKETKKMAKDKYEQSKDFKKTGVIPPMYKYITSTSSSGKANQPHAGSNLTFFSSASLVSESNSSSASLSISAENPMAPSSIIATLGVTSLLI